MSEEIQKYGAKQEDENEELVKLQKFIKLTERKPAVVKKHKQGFAYVPISEVENQLNRVFFGLWNWVVKNTQVVGNEILVQGDLEVFHPITKTWIRRSGVGASQIRMRKGSKPSMENKIPTALQMDYPHAEAEAFKNAAQKFGKLFGRDLRRDFESQYEELIKPELMTEEQIRMFLETYEVDYVRENKQKVFNQLKDKADKKLAMRLIEEYANGSSSK